MTIFEMGFIRPSLAMVMMQPADGAGEAAPSARHLAANY
jgi:hypothetical protein